MKLWMCSDLACYNPGMATTIKQPRRLTKDEAAKRLAAVDAAVGCMAHVKGGGSYAFIREKRREIARELRLERQRNRSR